MKTKTTRHAGPVTRLVERGFAIHQQLTTLNEEFKKIKEQLKFHAAARPNEFVPLLDKDSAGAQWIVFGNGCECRVVFAEPKVKTEFDAAEPDFLTIQSLAGDHLKNLFHKVTVYRLADKRDFRSKVNGLLTPKAATQLLELCSSDSEPKIIWKARQK